MPRRSQVDPVDPILGPRLRALRKSVGATQAAVAEALGTSLVTYRSWESGRRQPSGASARLLEIAQSHPGIVFTWLSGEDQPSTEQVTKPAGTSRPTVRSATAASPSEILRTALQEVGGHLRHRHTLAALVSELAEQIVRDCLGAKFAQASTAHAWAATLDGARTIVKATLVAPGQNTLHLRVHGVSPYVDALLIVALTRADYRLHAIARLALNPAGSRWRQHIAARERLAIDLTSPGPDVDLLVAPRD